MPMTRGARAGAQSAWLLAGAVTLQAALGIVTLLHQAPLHLALPHQLLAIVVLTVAVVHAERLSNSPRAVSRGRVGGAGRMIDVATEGGIAVVTMTHGKANALDLEFCEALVVRFGELRTADVKAIVLTGAGKNLFRRRRSETTDRRRRRLRARLSAEPAPGFTTRCSFILSRW